MRQGDRLFQLIIQLFEQVKHRAPKEDEIAQINRILSETSLNTDQNIPEWILLFFDAAVSRKNVRGSMGSDVGNLSSVCSMITKLSYLLGGNLEDEGEYISLIFEKNDLEAVVFLQGNTYEISA